MGGVTRHWEGQDGNKRVENKYMAAGLADTGSQQVPSYIHIEKGVQADLFAERLSCRAHTSVSQLRSDPLELTPFLTVSTVEWNPPWTLGGTDVGTGLPFSISPWGLAVQVSGSGRLRIMQDRDERKRAGRATRLDVCSPWSC